MLTVANLKEALIAEGVESDVIRGQCQMLSKVTIVLKKLQGPMTDAEVDTNVKAMYGVCHRNVMQCIVETGLQGMEDCLSGHVSSVYGKLLRLKR